MVTENGLPSQRLPRLDALRGLAALAVVLFHFTMQYPNFVPGGGVPFTFDYGFYGVHLFFMISGFVILMSIEHRDGGSFIRSRFIRLYPVFWAAVLLTTLVLTIDPILGPPPTLGQVLANLTMFEEYANIQPIDGAYWSLTYELGFYIMMFAIFAAGQRRFVVWLPLWMTLGALAFPHIKAFIPHPLHLMVGINDYSHLFATGMALYLARSRGWSPAYAAILPLVPVAQFQQDGATGAAIVLAAILIMMWGTAQQKSLPRIAAPLLWLGAISYALYLVHQMIGYVILARVQQAGVEPWAAHAIALCGVIALGAALTYLVEKPSARWLKKALPQFDLASLNRFWPLRRLRS